MRSRRWSSDLILMREMTALLDWIEGELDRVPVSRRGGLTHLRTEIIRRRTANHEERGRRRWSSDRTLMVEQTRLLDWIEAELDRLAAERDTPATGRA